MKKINICVIGGGSRLWAISLLKDLVLHRTTAGHISLYDIDEEAAQSNQEVARRMFTVNHEENRFTVDACTDIGKALTGSDIVVIAIEPGATECRYGDLVLPRQYGIIETVGDTTGPGGIFRAKRALPVFFTYAKLIEKYCPDAWVINYTNPMTLCTAALYKSFPRIKAFGCCHEVFHLEEYIASLAAKWLNIPVPGRKEINVNITGVNHFTFFTSASWNGIDLMPRLKALADDPATYKDMTAAALERIRQEKWFECDQLVALELLRTFGAFGAAGDRHLCEFIPWMLADEDELHRYGITCTPYEWRLRQAKEKRAHTFTDTELEAHPSGEEGVDIILALMGEHTLVTNMNMPNIGQISYLPRGHIVETNGVLSADSVRPLVSEDPPESIQLLEQHIAAEQDMVLESCWTGDDTLLFQAFVNDPLVRIPLSKARELFARMQTACAMKYEKEQKPMKISF